MASSFYTRQLLPAPFLSPSTCPGVGLGQLPAPQKNLQNPGQTSLRNIKNALFAPGFFWKLPFFTFATQLLLHVLGACMFQQSELQTILKCRLLLTKLDQSHSFVDTSDNSRGQEQTVLRDVLLCFSIFELPLLKQRGRKEREKTKKGLEASSSVRGLTVLHPSQAPSVLGFVPLCLSLLHSQPQSRAYC